MLLLLLLFHQNLQTQHPTKKKLQKEVWNDPHTKDTKKKKEEADEEEEEEVDEEEEDSWASLMYWNLSIYRSSLQKNLPKKK